MRGQRSRIGTGKHPTVLIGPRPVGGNRRTRSGQPPLSPTLGGRLGIWGTPPNPRQGWVPALSWDFGFATWAHIQRTPPLSTPSAMCSTSSVIPAEAGIQETDPRSLLHTPIFNPLCPPFLGDEKGGISGIPRTPATSCCTCSWLSRWERMIKEDRVYVLRHSREGGNPCRYSEGHAPSWPRNRLWGG